jgi:hypothetical protein
VAHGWNVLSTILMQDLTSIACALNFHGIQPPRASTDEDGSQGHAYDEPSLLTSTVPIVECVMNIGFPSKKPRWMLLCASW